jgi:hypothetical protein
MFKLLTIAWQCVFALNTDITNELGAIRINVFFINIELRLLASVIAEFV